MSKKVKLIVLLAVLLAVAGALLLKQRAASAVGAQTVDSAQSSAVPRLVDLGADKCIPCRMMAPILDELRTTYQGRLEVVFIDVWKDNSAGEKYGISSIPTQIFYDENGGELYRHVGFISKADILAKWSELGYSFN